MLEARRWEETAQSYRQRVIVKIILISYHFLSAYVPQKNIRFLFVLLIIDINTLATMTFPNYSQSLILFPGSIVKFFSLTSTSLFILLTLFHFSRALSAELIFFKNIAFPCFYLIFCLIFWLSFYYDDDFC